MPLIALFTLLIPWLSTDSASHPATAHSEIYSFSVSHGLFLMLRSDFTFFADTLDCLLSFFLPLPITEALYDTDLVTLYDTIRSPAGGVCREYDMILSRLSCTISISEPLLLRYSVLGELRSLST